MTGDTLEPASLRDANRSGRTFSWPLHRHSTTTSGMSSRRDEAEPSRGEEAEATKPSRAEPSRNRAALNRPQQNTNNHKTIGEGREGVRAR